MIKLKHIRRTAPRYRIPDLYKAWIKKRERDHTHIYIQAEKHHA